MGVLTWPREITTLQNQRGTALEQRLKVSNFFHVPILFTEDIVGIFKKIQQYEPAVSRLVPSPLALKIRDIFALTDRKRRVIAKAPPTNLSSLLQSGELLHRSLDQGYVALYAECD